MRKLKNASVSDQLLRSTNTVNLKMEGVLGVTERLKALMLTPQEKRKLHIRIADALAREMKKAVRKTVMASDVELFDGSEVQRKRQAKYFASQVGRWGSANNGLLYDRRKKAKGKAPKSNRATAQQAERMRELGFKIPVRRIQRDFTIALAGMIIRKVETEKGITQKRRVRRNKFSQGSLLMLVWRESGQDVLAAVDLAKIVRSFLEEQKHR